MRTRLTPILSAIAEKYIREQRYDVKLFNNKM